MRKILHILIESTEKHEQIFRCQRAGKLNSG
ncbi:Uncharacterised protein [Vibrio cholerae]|nr:Uncharacterised protein [Vibrio cholerae]